MTDPTISLRNISFRLPNVVRKERTIHITPAERDALVEAVEALNVIVQIEDIYRVMPVESRKDLLPVFEEKHRQVMNTARVKVTRFDFGSKEASS